MSKLTIRTRIILAVTLVFAVTLLIFAHLVYRSSRRAEIARLDARLENHATKLQTELEDEADNRLRPDAGELRSIRTDGLLDLRLRLFDSTGAEIISDSALSEQPAVFAKEALSGRTLRTRIEIHHQRYRGLWAPIEVNDRIQGVLELAASMEGVDISLRHLWILFLITIPGALLLTALAVYWIVSLAFRPMTEMVDTARKITASNLDQRLALPTSRDEVRNLAETLNSMMERIDAAFKSQRQFVADASHEIRTPLTVVFSELEYTLRTTRDESIKENLQIAVSEIDRLARLVDGLLLLARLDAAQLHLVIQPIRLDELVAECIQLIAPLAGRKEIQIRLQVKDAIECNADGEKLRRAFVNLLDNAVKYSPSASIVSVSLRTSESRPGLVLLSIEDCGPGVAANDLPNIFKRFYRADTSRANDIGSGLGLAIADQLIALHGGKIVVRSELGRGSTFVVELPLG